jgi:hypothetical protein
MPSFTKCVTYSRKVTGKTWGHRILVVALYETGRCGSAACPQMTGLLYLTSQTRQFTSVFVWLSPYFFVGGCSLRRTIRPNSSAVSNSIVYKTHENNDLWIKLNSVTIWFDPSDNSGHALALRDSSSTLIHTSHFCRVEYKTHHVEGHTKSPTRRLPNLVQYKHRPSAVSNVVPELNWIRHGRISMSELK